MVSRFLEGHHIYRWADGGTTKLSNLVMLCRFHHRQVHEGQAEVLVPNDGAFRFTGARGKCFDAVAQSKGNDDGTLPQNRRGK